MKHILYEDESLKDKQPVIPQGWIYLRLLKQVFWLILYANLLTLLSKAMV